MPRPLVVELNPSLSLGTFRLYLGSEAAGPAAALHQRTGVLFKELDVGLPQRTLSARRAGIGQRKARSSSAASHARERTDRGAVRGATHASPSIAPGHMSGDA
jgi:hypothetical protein